MTSVSGVTGQATGRETAPKGIGTATVIDTDRPRAQLLEPAGDDRLRDRVIVDHVARAVRVAEIASLRGKTVEEAARNPWTGSPRTTRLRAVLEPEAIRGIAEMTDRKISPSREVVRRNARKATTAKSRVAVGASVRSEASRAVRRRDGAPTPQVTAEAAATTAAAAAEATAPAPAPKIRSSAAKLAASLDDFKVGVRSNLRFNCDTFPPNVRRTFY